MKIVIIGTGNVATALGRAFLKAGHTIVQVAGKSPGALKKLSNRLDAQPVLIPDRPTATADCYIVAIKDDSIASMADYLKDVKGIVAHTSGSIPMNVIKAKNAGVFYPVETFRGGKPLSLSKVPVCLEGNSPATLRKLQTLAASVKATPYLLNSSQRLALHLAAVFANNFTNHLNASAFELLHKYQLPDSLLHNLIRSTALTAINSGPVNSQTGPAIRNDLKTLAAHRKLLTNQKRLLKLYNTLTADIIAESRHRTKK